jgi:hypothetical protein
MPSYGAVAVIVKCPECRINFGLWLPKSQAPYVRTTRLAPALSLGLAEVSDLPAQPAAAPAAAALGTELPQVMVHVQVPPPEPPAGR